MVLLLFVYKDLMDLHQFFQQLHQQVEVEEDLELIQQYLQEVDVLEVLEEEQLKPQVVQVQEIHHQ